MRSLSVSNKLMPIVALVLLANIACKKEKSVSTEVKKAADFTICGAVCVDSSMTFCADPTPGGAALLWNFGDGATSTESKPVHVYKDTGTFEVTLKAASATASTIKKTISLYTCSPYTQTVCRTWHCDQSYFYTREWPDADTTVYTNDVSLKVTYEHPGAIKINGDVLYYDKVASNSNTVKFSIGGSYSERSLYYYPAKDSIKYYNFNRTGFTAYNITTLLSKS